MAAHSTRPAETVRKVAELALGDAVEITLLIALMRGQDAGGVNNQLDAAGAGRAAGVVRNALMARLVLLIARAYSEPKHGDLHLREATCLLKDNTTRQIFGSSNGYEKLAAFDAHWAKCRGDHRLPPIKAFRDKFTAHLGEPKDIQEATYSDLFAFGAETAKAMELLALATGIAIKPLDTDPSLVSSPEAFWAHWKTG
jgi:AbiU2